MTNSASRNDSLRKRLFPEAGLISYAVLDGAAIANLPVLLSRFGVEHVCLYRGELAPDLAAVAPYLVRLQAAAPFTDLVLKAWGQHQGIFALAEAADIRVLRKHFRQFLMVRGPDAKLLYFRYYDPRVLRAYLPHCNRQEIGYVFGPVRYYLCEDEDPAFLLQFAAGEQLRTERIALRINQSRENPT